MTYRHLDPEHVLRTVEMLERRIQERFPGSGLGRVCGELLAMARESSARAEEMARPNWWLRGGVALLIVVTLVVIGAATIQLRIRPQVPDFSSLVQAIDAAINDVVFLGIGIFFLVTLERRLKRGRALRALHELRSLAHIVDMHQLTKDPEQFLSASAPTPSSPRRTMTRYELGRYLDYCSELLSLTSKVAALYVQRFDDELVLGAVNELEDLTSGLSRKIWQKIMVLDAALSERTEAEA